MFVVVSSPSNSINIRSASSVTGNPAASIIEPLPSLGIPLVFCLAVGEKNGAAPGLWELVKWFGLAQHVEQHGTNELQHHSRGASDTDPLDLHLLLPTGY